MKFALRNIILFLVIFLLFISLIKAQQLEKAIHLLEQRGEIVIKFEKPVDSNLKDLSELMSIDKIDKSSGNFEIYAYLNKEQFKAFQAKNIDFELIELPLLKASSMCADLAGVHNWNCYPTYDQYVSLMQSFETDYPGLCKVYEFGQSINGRKLLALKISDNVTQKEEEPEFFYTSSMHGDEVTGYVLMLRLIQYLLSNYNTDQRVKDLVDNTEIWINPLSNPDGTYFSNSDISQATRFNSNGIDLNRNFPCYNPYPTDYIDQHPDNKAWQQENIYMMNFLKSHNFVLAANFHGGSEVVNYPWDVVTSSEKIHPDDTWYQLISHEYADTVHANSSSYMNILDGLPNSSGITNGGDWYTITGGRQDYMNYFLHSREVTIEISSVKMLNPNLLPLRWNYNYRSFLNYIDRVHKGVYGKITDQYGNPVKAKVFIQNHHYSNSDIYSDTTTGMYYRMLSTGTYHFIYSADYHAPQQVDLNVNSDGAIEQNIVLIKDPVGIQDISIINKITNPFNSHIQITMELNNPEIIEIRLYDLMGRQVLYQKAKGVTGSNKIEIPTQSIHQGIYICYISSGEHVSKTKLIKSTE